MSRMYKKLKISLLLLALTFIIQSFSFPISTQAFYFQVIRFETDKQVYHTNDTIGITASWTLIYNNLTEISFMQVKIFDSNEELVWNSTKYTTIGTSEHSWSVNISRLGLVMSIRNCNLTLKLFNYFLDINLGSSQMYYLETLKIQIREIPKKEINNTPSSNVLGLILAWIVLFGLAGVFITLILRKR